MSHTVKIENSQIGVMSLVTEGQANATSRPVAELYEALTAFADFAAMSEISLVADGGNPFLYVYRAEPKVGADLDATWLFDDSEDDDPSISATIVSWDLSVLEFGGGLRKHLIKIRSWVGLISFNVVFP